MYPLFCFTSQFIVNLSVLYFLPDNVTQQYNLIKFRKISTVFSFIKLHKRMRSNKNAVALVN